MDGQTMDASVLQRIEALINQGVTQAEVSRESGVSSTALSRWLRGEYPGDSAAVERKLAMYLGAREEQREAAAIRTPAPEYVPTESGERVLALLRFAQMFGVIVLAYGVAGVSKTRAIKRYADTSPNVWHATMTAASKGVVTALEVIATALGLKPEGGALRMFKAIVQRVSGTKGLIVIDEAQHLSNEALDQIRAITDETGVGIALVGNETVFTRMDGARAAYLDRLRSRIARVLKLGRPSPKDVQALLHAYGLNGNCQRLGESIAAKPGALRTLALTLDLAQSYAAAAREPLNAGHFQSAHTDLAGG